jgi:hypothetical protein
VNPSLAIEPASLTFDATEVGQVSEPRVATIRNTSLFPIRLGNATSSSGELRFDGREVRAALYPGETVELAIRFAPQEGGTREFFARCLMVVCLLGREVAGPALAIRIRGAGRPPSRASRP